MNTKDDHTEDAQRSLEARQPRTVGILASHDTVAAPKPDGGVELTKLPPDVAARVKALLEGKK